MNKNKNNNNAKYINNELEFADITSSIINNQPSINPPK